LNKEQKKITQAAKKRNLEAEGESFRKSRMEVKKEMKPKKE
jgi:hypothetical protein